MAVHMVILMALVTLTVTVSSAPLDRVKRQYHYPRRFMPNFAEDMGEPCELGDCFFGYPQYLRERGLSTQMPPRGAPRGFMPPMPYGMEPSENYPFAPPAGLREEAPFGFLPPRRSAPAAPPASVGAAPPVGPPGGAPGK